MNWRVSSLDGYRLVSNSDAHSPPMLGREATAFMLPSPDYYGIYHALRTGDGFGGTVEFFPEEGKYHLDGHRACDVRMTPEETREAGGLCPGCGKKPTIGVQHRVDVLADRPAGYRPDGAAGFTSFVQLPEILGEIAGVGPKAKSVTAQAAALVERFGPELAILGDVPLDDLAAGAASIVAEAIGRLRRGEVRREAGYDGVYGTIRLFEPDELAGAALFDLPRAAPQRRVPAAAGPGAGIGVGVGAGIGVGSGSGSAPLAAPAEPGSSAGGPAGLDPDQQAIVTHDGGPLLVVAGPGAGKTRVLTHAIAHRIAAGLAPERCLAVTFTRRARDELRNRLTALLGEERAAGVSVGTFHGLGLLILREQFKRAGLDTEPKVADEKSRQEILRSLSAAERTAALGARIAEAKRVRASPLAAAASEREAEVDGLLARYDAALRERGMVDLDDLVTLPTALLAGDPALAEAYRERWTDVFVDEYQDVDEQQYLLLRQLCQPAPPATPGTSFSLGASFSPSAHSSPAAPGPRVCAIGDPDQAIYGFRGGDVGYFLRFAEDFGAGGAPVATVRLSRSYRSAPTIVRAAMQLIRPGTLVPGRELIPARTDIPDALVVLHAVADEREEADAVAAEIEKLLGATSFHALDSSAVDGRDQLRHQLSFADFAVLYRTSAQAAAVEEALARRGFPVQRRAHSRLAEMPGVSEILAQLALSGTGTLPLSQPRSEQPSSVPPPFAEQLLSEGHGCGNETPITVSLPQPSGAVMVAGLLGEAVRRAVAESERAPVQDETHGAEARAAMRAAADVLGPLAVRCGSDLDRFLDEIALGAEVDTWDPRADRISLLTLHAAKGLEFPVVFIVGCDDGLLPLRSWHRGSGRAEVDYAEERRLLFVGMTRATTRLTLLTATRRTLRGEVTACTPSPFLASVDPALLDDRGDVGAARARRKARVQQPALF
ncbi:AAA family ATPase [Trebonia kvetii]|uniref:DNA 3'-5' helicase n=2 Tax=Trebonia kvetii TaxID=2480626 RepID=A0A6P2BTR0_9ACTN|nr:AAA family ATPase [Trebonia kvetii]